MPMTNYHAARVADPDKFDEESFRTKEIADGILAVMGKLKDGDGSMVIQALRFAADKFTAAEAKAWCKEHDYELLEFAEAKEEESADEEAKPEKHLALVEAIRGRKYVGEFGYGVCTADAIVAKAIDEIGVGAVQRYAKLAGSFDREAAVKDASRRLTYCEKDMVAEITATVGSFQDLLPKGMTAPPHTLMLIKNVLTTPRKDRDGDILRSEGAKVDPAGPLLWQHMYNLPIGKHLAVVEQTKSHVKEVNALLDLNELTEDAAKLFEAGALRFSHGFQALDWEEMKGEGGHRMDDRPSFDIKSFEVLERSAVSIPSCVDAVVELYARGKLCSEPMQRKAKALFDSRQKVFTGATLDGVATKKDVVAWNKSIAEAVWDVPSQKLESSTMLFDWCSKFCGCEIKHLAEIGGMVSTVRMASWLTAFDDWKKTSGCTMHDVRNISGQCESPPGYEEILLNSKRKARFLVDGSMFLHDAQKRPIVLMLMRCYYGLEITMQCRREDLDAVLEIRKWIDDRAKTYKFLKGEKFSLCGEFLEPTGDKFADVFLNAENTNALSRSVTLLNSKADKMPCRGVMMLGPPGCLHPDTPIYDPVDGTTISVSDREQRSVGFHVYAMDANGEIVIAKSEKPWKYEPAEMIRLTFSNGEQMTVTKGHRFWVESDNDRTGQGCFATAEQIVRETTRGGDGVALPSIGAVSLRLLVSRQVRRQSTSELVQKVQPRDVLRSTRTLAGFPENYFLDLRPCDEQLLLPAIGDRGYVRQAGGAPPHNHDLWRLDDSDGTHTNTLRAMSCLLSSKGSTDRTATRLESATRRQVRSEHRARAVCSCSLAARSLRSEDPPHTFEQRSVFARQTMSFEANATVASSPLPSSGVSRRSPETRKISQRLQTETIQIDAEEERLRIEVQSSEQACDSPLLERNISRRSQYSEFCTVVKAESIGIFPYYDFHVPLYENYWACGFFHHNTGKTLSGRVLMTECPDATFIWVAAKDFYCSGSFGGITGALELARELTPSIVFLEDIDNWMDGRGVDLMKSELDGIARHRGVLTVMTTNYPERMDKALIDRPGRFHDVLMFDLPDAKNRKRMLDAWMPDANENQRSDVSQKTNGWSGAHLYELCQFAKTLQETEQMAAGEALTKSVEKIEQQRKLIDSVQLNGSHYLPNRRATGSKSLRMQFKAGRVLSQRNMDALGDCLADLDELAGMMPEDMPRGANALMQRVMSRLKEVIESAKPEQERPDAKPKEGENGKGLVEAAILGAAIEQLHKYERIIDTEFKVRRANAFAEEYRRLTV